MYTTIGQTGKIFAILDPNLWTENKNNDLSRGYPSVINNDDYHHEALHKKKNNAGRSTTALGKDPRTRMQTGRESLEHLSLSLYA